MKVQPEVDSEEDGFVKCQFEEEEHCLVKCHDVDSEEDGFVKCQVDCEEHCLVKCRDDSKPEEHGQEYLVIRRWLNVWKVVGSLGGHYDAEQVPEVGRHRANHCVARGNLNYLNLNCHHDGVSRKVSFRQGMWVRVEEQRRVRWQQR